MIALSKLKMQFVCEGTIIVYGVVIVVSLEQKSKPADIFLSLYKFCNLYIMV